MGKIACHHQSTQVEFNPWVPQWWEERSDSQSILVTSSHVLWHRQHSHMELETFKKQYPQKQITGDRWTLLSTSWYLWETAATHCLCHAYPFMMNGLKIPLKPWANSLPLSCFYQVFCYNNEKMIKTDNIQKIEGANDQAQ